MTCAEKRVVDDVCETAANGAPLVAQVAVEDGRQERVVKRITPLSRCITCAAKAGSSASASLARRVDPVDLAGVLGEPRERQLGGCLAERRRAEQRYEQAATESASGNVFLRDSVGRLCPVISHSFPSVILNRKA